jgi:hypothetical protein
MVTLLGVLLVAVLIVALVLGWAAMVLQRDAARAETERLRRRQQP